MEASPLLSTMRTAIEADLKNSLDPLQSQASILIADMISYHLGWNQPGAEGKRVRPIFTLLCCAAAGGEWKRALAAGSAIEWIHNFSLIHDDIQDQSATRRGRATLWTQQGIPQAINTGDAIFALARLTVQRIKQSGVSPETTLLVMQLLDQACLDLTIGQHLDIDFERRNLVKVTEYLEMIGGKTGALLQAACEAGALIGGAGLDQAHRYGEFGRHVGLAFQIYDDVLGIWGKTEQTGKPAGDDLVTRKKTLPLLYGMERSALVRELWEDELKDEGQIRAMLRALEASGAKDYALEQADSLTHQALGALHEAQPLQPFGQELETLSLSLLHRNS